MTDCWVGREARRTADEPQVAPACQALVIAPGAAGLMPGFAARRRAGQADLGCLPLAAWSTFIATSRPGVHLNADGVILVPPIVAPHRHAACLILPFVACGGTEDGVHEQQHETRQQGRPPQSAEVGMMATRTNAQHLTCTHIHQCHRTRHRRCRLAIPSRQGFWAPSLVADACVHACRQAA